MVLNLLVQEIFRRIIPQTASFALSCTCFVLLEGMTYKRTFWKINKDTHVLKVELEQLQRNANQKLQQSKEVEVANTSELAINKNEEGWESVIEMGMIAKKSMEKRREILFTERFQQVIDQAKQIKELKKTISQVKDENQKLKTQIEENKKTINSLKCELETKPKEEQSRVEEPKVEQPLNEEKKAVDVEATRKKNDLLAVSSYMINQLNSTLN